MAIEAQELEENQDLVVEPAIGIYATDVLFGIINNNKISQNNIIPNEI